MAKKVKYNDGGHLDFNDLQNDQKFARRDLLRYMADAWLVDPNYTVQSCNPTQVRPSVTTGTLTMGATHWAFGVTPADTDDRAAVLAELPAINQSVSAVSATNFRQDIIAVKLDENVNGSLTATDFEDAVTRAKSSQNLVRLISDNISFEVVEGTEQTTEALAFSNPPTPSAGFTAVAGYILDDAENSIDTIVHVPPVGKRTVIRASLIHADPGFFTFSGIWNHSAGGGISQLDVDLYLPNHMFIESMKLVYRFTDTSTTGHYELRSISQDSGSTVLYDFQSLLDFTNNGLNKTTTINFATQGIAPIWSWTDAKGHHPLSGDRQLSLDFLEQPSAGNASQLRVVDVQGIVWQGGGI